jgi:hypothetical protein
MGSHGWPVSLWAVLSPGSVVHTDAAYTKAALITVTGEEIRWLAAGPLLLAAIGVPLSITGIFICLTIALITFLARRREQCKESHKRGVLSS